MGWKWRDLLYDLFVVIVNLLFAERISTVLTVTLSFLILSHPRAEGREGLRKEKRT